MNAANLDEAFANGDYHFVAASKQNDRWQTFAALGLCANSRPALEGLAKFDHAEARFYEGVSHWIDGNDAAAIRLLSTCTNEHARNLLALIKKPQISILSQLPWQRSSTGPHSILNAGAMDSKFKIKNLSFTQGDAPYQVYGDIHDYYDAANPPDFFLSEMIEWQMTPPNLQEIPCPTVGHTADFDMHIQPLYPWLQVFDEILVTDTTERADVVGLVDVPVTTVPKTFAMPLAMPGEISGERPLDILVTGNIFHPYFDEKAALYGMLNQLPNMRNLFFNGMVNHDIYYNLLRQSKVSIAFIRHHGATPSRGIEALSVGTGLLAQNETTLGLWLGESEGLHTYDSTPLGLSTAVERIFDDVEPFQEAALRGMQIVRNEFDPWRVASQYLRTATFIAARPRKNRTIAPKPKQFRTAAWHGWLQHNMAETYTDLRNAHLEQWRQTAPESHSADSLSKPARELLLEYSSRSRRLHTPHDTHFVDSALNIMKTSLQMYPDSLMLRFNFIRSALHFGGEDDCNEAKSLLKKTLDAGSDNFELSPLDDVMPWDYCHESFNYKHYYETVTQKIRSADQGIPALKNIIFASLHFYAGRFTKEKGQYAAAVTLDPNFAIYDLWRARELASSGVKEMAVQALPVLQTLVLESVYPIDAYSLINAMEIDHEIRIENADILDRRITRIYEQTVEDKRNDTVPYTPYDISQRLGHFQDSGVEEVRKSSRVNVEISIILSDTNGSRYPKLYNSLLKQTIARERYEIVSTDLYFHISKIVDENADTILRTLQADYLPKQNTGYNFSLTYAKGEIIIIIHDDIELPAEALESILHAFSKPDNDQPYCVTNTGGTTALPGRTYLVAMKRDSIILEHGLDESAFHAGVNAGPAELVKRLQMSKKIIAELDVLHETKKQNSIPQDLKNLIHLVAPIIDSPFRRAPEMENPYIRFMRNSLISSKASTP